MLTILWVTTLTNAFNFIDSSDGLAVGLSGLSSAFFIFISLNTSQNEILILCTIILGICIGLYFFNSYPAKLFLGDSGAQTFGFILATIAILYNPKIGTQSSTWFVPVMIFFIPLFDLVLVILSRIRRKKKYISISRPYLSSIINERFINSSFCFDYAWCITCNESDWLFMFKLEYALFKFDFFIYAFF